MGVIRLALTPSTAETAAASWRPEIRRSFGRLELRWDTTGLDWAGQDPGLPPVVWNLCQVGDGLGPFYALFDHGWRGEEETCRTRQEMGGRTVLAFCLSFLCLILSSSL